MRLADDGALPGRMLQALDGAASDHFADQVFDVLAGTFPLRHAWIYLLDYSENLLRPLPTCTAPPPLPGFLEMRTSFGGRVLSNRTAAADQDGSVWVPITQRGEPVGVIDIGLARAADVFPLLELAGGLSVSLGAAIVGARRRYDLLESVRGASALTLEAAIQWSVLAPTVHEEPGLEVAARVVPATEHAGDAWDFSAHDTKLSFLLLDAVGHGLHAGLLSALAIGAYRWSRRKADDLAASAAIVDEAIAADRETVTFATAILGELERTTGYVSWVCAGHPPPLVVHGGSAVRLQLEQPGTPLGLGGDRHVNRYRLRPGGALLLYSDGVVEAKGGGGQRYADERLRTSVEQGFAAPSRLDVVVRNILDDVTAYAGGVLRDDATLFCVRWNRSP
jgi:serine phosphatase RsbU (regulator of sigma subunit)